MNPNDDGAVPRYLSPASRAWLQTHLQAYQGEALPPATHDLLAYAAVQRDLANTARRQINREGVTVGGGAAGPRQHPALKTFQDAVTAYRAIVKDLGLVDDADDLDGALRADRRKARNRNDQPHRRRSRHT
jgi:phage terminase small subunit